MKTSPPPASRLALVRWFCAVLWLGSTGACLATAPWLLHNEQVQLQVEKRGAIVSDLRLSGETRSWLSERTPPEQDALFGHFLCFDRWGPVTPEEQAAGLVFHGAAARVDWSLLATPTSRQLDLSTTLPVVGLRAERAYEVAASGGGFCIRTTVSNPTTEPRPFNVVEHVTLATAWNDPQVRLHTNATAGLVHHRGQWIEAARVRWPQWEWGDEREDLRGAFTRRGRWVVSLVFPDDAEWAWVCVTDPVSRRLLAYVWRTADFPWLNLFWFADGSRVLQRAIEPGTTGLHRPLPELLAASPQLGRPVVGHLLPEARRTYQIWGFAAPLPDGMSGEVELSRAADGRWMARDRDGHDIELGDFTGGGR